MPRGEYQIFFNVVILLGFYAYNRTVQWGCYYINDKLYEYQ